MSFREYLEDEFSSTLDIFESSPMIIGGFDHQLIDAQSIEYLASL